MIRVRASRTLLLLMLAGLVAPTVSAAGETGDAQRLVAAMLADTPLEEDLQSLTDEVGGRPTGSKANLAAVDWALARFAEAGVEAVKEPFTMPLRWLEGSAWARVSTGMHGAGLGFEPRVAAMPFSAETPPAGLRVPLVDGGFGTEDDFHRLGKTVDGAAVLIETDELLDVPGLFKEYVDGVEIDRRAIAAGASALVYVGSRARNTLYRHNAPRGVENRHPMLVMERESGLRALRLLRAGKKLQIHTGISVDGGGPYESFNVIGEIRGREAPQEVVLLGAHLDSWGLGTGALDNGCNVALVIDIARQIRRLGLAPRRTLRFALFNGEEQGLHGSRGYTETHSGELDDHVMASSFDIGSGRITGFFFNGPPAFGPAVTAALEPVAGLGPFENLDQPIVGTDNYDFMMQGVANLVANQESANYGPNYHAATDTFDKVDLGQLRLNAAIAAAVVWSFAEMEVGWKRSTREDLEMLLETTDLERQMRSLSVWDSWVKGERGLPK